MSEKKHTPGPWKVSPFLTPEREDDPMMVYAIEAGDLQERYDAVDLYDEDAFVAIHAENAANAQLIEAAPDLFEVACHLLEEHPEMIPAHHRQELATAINKAKGSS